MHNKYLKINIFMLRHPNKVKKSKKVKFNGFIKMEGS